MPSFMTTSSSDVFWTTLKMSWSLPSLNSTLYSWNRFRTRSAILAAGLGFEADWLEAGVGFEGSWLEPGLFMPLGGLLGFFGTVRQYLAIWPKVLHWKHRTLSRLRHCDFLWPGLPQQKHSMRFALPWRRMRENEDAWGEDLADRILSNNMALKIDVGVVDMFA